MSPTSTKPNHKTPPSTPRWVKVLGLIALALLLLFVALNLTGIGGTHSPNRHTPTITHTEPQP